MDTIEYTDVVDINDNLIGYKPRHEITDFDIYRVSSLWIFDKGLNLLISQRPLWKKHDPGKWTESAVGTVEHGETYESNIVKEAYEELGLKIKTADLIFISKKLHETAHERMFGCIYALKLNKSLPAIKPNLNEVPSTAWIDKDHLSQEFKTQPNKYVTGLETFYFEVWNRIHIR